MQEHKVKYFGHILRHKVMQRETAGRNRNMGLQLQCMDGNTYAETGHGGVREKGMAIQNN